MIFKGYEFIEDNGCLIIKNVKDFNPVQIFECGQCFRWRKRDNRAYFGVVRDRCVEVIFVPTPQTLQISQTSPPPPTLSALAFSESEGDVIISNSRIGDAEFWYNYFDLGTDYSKIKDELRNDKILEIAIKYAPGIRILKQDFNEMLISFIISSNNSIPRIMNTIEKISERYGDKLTVEGKTYYTFPSMKTLGSIEPEDLKFSSAGFRCDYIVKTARLVESCRFNENTLKEMSYAQALDLMQQFRGVGQKVADCVLLFSGIKMEAFPVDVWVKRVMEEIYLKKTATFKEISLFADIKFGMLAGYAQQYLFYYARENKIGSKK